MKTINRACSIAYELVFSMSFVLVILAPFHAMSTRHLTLAQSIDSSHAIIVGETWGLAVGEKVSLYRFNHGWKAPIGTARIESIGHNSAQIAVNPETMSWPLGRHGTVSRASNGKTYASIGSNDGIAEGNYLNIYRDRTNIAQAEILKVEPDRSLIAIPQDIGDPAGLVASDFTVATQVVVYGNGMQSGIEIASICLVLLSQRVGHHLF